MRPIKIALGHQGLWDMQKLSMPLALGYLKSVALADSDIQDQVAIELFNYNTAHTVVRIASEMLMPHVPDIVAFSVFGWNFRNFGYVADTFRQLNPNGWCIFGGTHVAHQADRVFRMHPSVDIVVNGEGERTFCSLLRAYLHGVSRYDLGQIEGISYRTEEGSIITTPESPRIRNLDEIPSPFLTGAMPMTHEGTFLYDVALMETNRGCPYECAFCYWGGAVGQKIYSFSRDRLREELEFLGRMKVEAIALCDANFGMLPADRLFLDDLLATRRKFSYPRNLICSWAKNKSKVFYDIVREMKNSGMTTDFTLSLQTLSPEALRTSRRLNMRLNDFEDLCRWIKDNDLNAYAELIWGLPGETYESFLQGYDRVARYTSKIATYTNLLLPNSSYSVQREDHKIVTIRGNSHDFENILSHRTLTSADNAKMHRFLFWSRALVEHMFFRYIWIPLREMAGIPQSAVLLTLDSWIEDLTTGAAKGLKKYREEVEINLDSSRIGPVLRALYCCEDVNELLCTWWETVVVPSFPSTSQEFARQLFVYERATRPIHDAVAVKERLQIVTLFDRSYYVRADVKANWNIPTIISSLDRTGTVSLTSTVPEATTLFYETGFADVVDNHEVIGQYSAKSMPEIEREAALRATGSFVTERPRHAAGLPVMD